MDTPDTTAIQDVVAAVGALKAQMDDLGLSLSLIDFQKIAYETGIHESTLRKLFAGEEISPSEIDKTFDERLTFLRQTRLRPDGEQYRPSEIAAHTGMSKETVLRLLNGSRNCRLKNSDNLERFFKVPSGFFTVSGGQALLTALKPTTEKVNLLTLLRGTKSQHVALRGTLTSGNDPLTEELRKALQSAVDRTHSEDPEISEIADTMRSLPAGPRRSVLGIVRSVLGLAGTDETGSPGRRA
ncbi:XRE family transcriptional regulator [Streptomyces flaveolus]|uniref:XRE family transcriptional regulator n=1 Tax=Streptomyces flaveolus TaxID=67297 RepID=UPI0036F7D8E7